MRDFAFRAANGEVYQVIDAFPCKVRSEIVDDLIVDRPFDAPCPLACVELLTPPDDACFGPRVLFDWNIGSRRSDLTFCSNLVVSASQDPFDDGGGSSATSFLRANSPRRLSIS